MRGLFLGLMLLSLSTWAKPVVVVHGDSLSAAYGLPKEKGWVNLMQQRCDCLVINTSQSGETTAGGLTRLPAILSKNKPDVLLIELGANDGLRGLPLQQAEANLTAMIRMSQAKGIQTILIATALPPNMGKTYTQQYFAVFSRIAQQLHLVEPPFLMAGFGGDMRNFQADGLHPVAAKQPQMLDNVWPPIKVALHSIKPRR